MSVPILSVFVCLSLSLPVTSASKLKGKILVGHHYDGCSTCLYKVRSLVVVTFDWKHSSSANQTNVSSSSVGLMID